MSGELRELRLVVPRTRSKLVKRAARVLAELVLWLVVALVFTSLGAVVGMGVTAAWPQ